MGAAKKVALGIVGFVALAALTLTGCMAVLFSGGVGNVIRNAKPAPDVEGRTITRARLKAAEEIEAALALADAHPGLTSYATSSDDRCYKGENNWKITEGFAHRCTIRMTRFYGVNGDFRARTVGLEDLLASTGWQLPRSPFPNLPPATFREVFASYYDVYCSGPRIAVFGSGRIPDMQCEASRLPRSRSDGYRRGDLVLWIECAERGERDFFIMEFVQRVPFGAQIFTLYEKKNLQDVEALVRDISASYKYVLSVTVQKTYFEN